MATTANGLMVAIDDADGRQWEVVEDHRSDWWLELHAQGADVFELGFGIWVSRDGGFTWAQEVTATEGLGQP